LKEEGDAALCTNEPIRTIVERKGGPSRGEHVGFGEAHGGAGRNDGVDTNDECGIAVTVLEETRGGMKGGHGGGACCVHRVRRPDPVETVGNSIGDVAESVSRECVLVDFLQ